MKQNTKWLASALAVTGVLAVANSVQAQYITGDSTLDNLQPEAAGGILSNPVDGASGLNLSAANGNYTWGQYNIATPQVFNPADNTIVYKYTINGPAPGTTGPDYNVLGGYNNNFGAAWEWSSVQPLLIDSNGNTVRYFGYDGYDLSYAAHGAGQGVANQDAGYSYNPLTQQVTITAPLNALTKAAISGGGTITGFQMSLDVGESLPDGYNVTINSILLTVPEPGTLALVGLGLAGLVIARRRVTVS